MSQTFSREEFYDLVWSKPMTHWAKEFRLSDVALHKACRKHDIPTPPPGWWAKQAAGKKVSRAPLPNLTAGVAANLTIASANLRGETAELSSVREQARMSLSGFDAIEESLSNPIVAKSFALLLKAKPADNGLLKIAREGTIALELAPQSLERAEMCLNRIAEAAIVLGFELLRDCDHVVFSNGTTLLPFSIKETVKRIPHVLTPKEIAEDEIRERRNARRWSNNDWELDTGNYSFLSRPRWDYIPTGQLSFEFDIYLRYAPQIRRSYKDAKIQRLDKLAPDIAVGMAVIAAAKLEDDKEAHAARMREAESKRRRDEAQRLQHVEARRKKSLENVLARFERVERLARLVSKLENEPRSDDTPRVETFLKWTRQQLTEAQYELSSDGLENLFQEHRIFGADDDHNFFARPYG